MTESSLKLKVADEEDLAVLAGLLQDALVPIQDVAFMPEEKRFILVANRYRWENPNASERVNCVVTLEGITRVSSRDIDRSKRADILELLTIMVEESALLLVFAGGGLIRLEAETISGHAADTGLPWPTQWRPRHPDE